MNPAAVLAKELADRVRSRALREGTAIEQLVQDEILRASDVPGEGWPELQRRVIDQLVGFGALQPYLDDPDVEEVWINSPDHVFIARAGVSERLDVALGGDEVRVLVERMLRPTGRRVDASQPFVDASLPDGSRLHVAIPDITRNHWSVNIRKFLPRLRTLPDLVGHGLMDEVQAESLAELVRGGGSVLVSGATQAGKTTLLTALLHAIAPRERIITVEETFELNLDRADHVGLQCRGPSLEGTGEVTLRRLVKEALRMRPDRLVIGEVREAEALDLLIALNSGLPGLCSVHARSARGALQKLSMLPLLAGRNIDAHFVTTTIASTIDAVVHLERGPDGVRRVTEVVAPNGVVDGEIQARDLFPEQGVEATR